MAIEVKVPIKLATAQSITTTGDKTTFRVSYNEFMITTLAVTVTTALAAADPATVSVEHRPTVGSDTGRTVIGVIELAAALAVGKVVYKEGLSFKLIPGAEIVVEVTGASATGAVDVDAIGYYVYNNPANNTAMAATA